MKAPAVPLLAGTCCPAGGGSYGPSYTARWPLFSSSSEGLSQAIWSWGTDSALPCQNSALKSAHSFQAQSWL